MAEKDILFFALWSVGLAQAERAGKIYARARLHPELKEQLSIRVSIPVNNVMARKINPPLKNREF